MRTKKSIGVLFWLLAIAYLFSTPLAQADSDLCLEGLKPLDKRKDLVLSLGGVWSLLEKNPQLRNQSTLGLRLDSDINKMMNTLKYLCETENGVPLNDLARFVTYNLEKMGEKNFKENQVNLGRPPAEVDIWIKFGLSAKQLQHRTLDADSVRNSIQAGSVLLKKYQELAQRIMDEKTIETVIKDIESFSMEVQEFFSSDPNFIIAIKETSQIPFWDVEENYGGS